jgi:hypothetical protein
MGYRAQKLTVAATGKEDWTATTGDSSPIECSDRVASAIAFQFIGAVTAASIKGSVDGVTFISLAYVNCATGLSTDSGTAVAAAGIYRIDATGLKTIKANVATNGSLTAIAVGMVDG